VWGGGGNARWNASFFWQLLLQVSEAIMMNNILAPEMMP
jgi:hypothetical protein